MNNLLQSQMCSPDRGNHRPDRPPLQLDQILSVVRGDRQVKEFGQWNISEQVYSPVTTGRQGFGPSSPETYASHNTNLGSTILSPRNPFHEGLGTRTVTPPPSSSIPSLQTPQSHEGMAAYSCDGDGDVVMADVEDLKAIMEVMHHVHERRFKDNQLYRRETSLIKPLSTLGRIDNPTSILVIDTSFILSHLHLIASIVNLHEIYGSVVVIPWATIQELDGLRKSTGRITMTTSTNLSGSKHNPAKKVAKTVEVACLARQAVNWQLKMFQMANKGVWGQKREECINADTCGDDSILDCARYFREVRGLVTVLLSDDRNLSVKARVYDLLTITFDPGITHSARTILDKIAEEVRVIQLLLGRPPLSSQPPPYLPANQQPFSLAQWYSPSYSLADKDAHMEDAPLSLAISPISPATHTFSPIIEVYNSSLNLSYSKYTSPPPFPAVTQPPPTYLPNSQPLKPARPAEASDREVRSSVYQLLERVLIDVTAAVPTLMHNCALACFGGDQYNLDYLHINFKELQDLDQIEQELSRHWHTIFSECLSYNIGQKLKEDALSTQYKLWIEWVSNRTGTNPRKIEFITWMSDWTIVWRGLYSKAAEAQQLDKSDAKLDWHKTVQWDKQLEMTKL